MQTLSPQQFRTAGRDRLGIVYKAVILLYVLAVVVLSYRDGMTASAKGIGIVLVGLFVFRALTTGEKIFFPTEYRLLMAWFLVAVVSSALSQSPDTALPRVLTLLQIMPIAFLISNLIVWNGDCRFYWICVVAAAVVSAVVTLTNPAEFMGVDGRLSGTLSNANAFAALLAGSFALCLCALMSTRNVLLRAAYLALAAFFLYMVGRTGSRMGMLASVAAVTAFFVCFQVSRKGKGLGRSLVVLIFGGLIVAGSVVYLTSSQFSTRLDALTESAEKGDFRAAGDMSLYGRSLLVRKAFQLAVEHPLLGVGLDEFRTEGIDYRTIGDNSHSNYAEILSNTGLIGATLYFAVYFSLWSRLIRAKATLQDLRYAVPFTIAAVVATIMLVLDIAWVTYYEKLAWLLLQGLIAQVHLVSRNANTA